MTRPESTGIVMAINFSISSRLACTAQTLWSAVSRMDQINFELAPYLAMSAPRAARDQTLEDVELGKRAFTSVILLFRLLPIDLHFVTLAERENGASFVETSSSLANALWRHERRIEAGGAREPGCTLTDRVSFRSRLPGLDRLLAPLVRALFAHRHRRLLARFGAASTLAADARPFRTSNAETRGKT